MQVLTQLETPRSSPTPLALTIGNFDGVHRGHQAILQKLRQKAGDSGTVAVITFSNHPSHVLPCKSPAPLILTPARKLHCLRSCGADLVYLLEFTPKLAQLAYDTFLKKVKEVYPFTFLALGEGATFGKKREGNKQALTELSKELDFTLEYLPKVGEDGEIISSGKIRALLEEGNFAKAKELLGHSFQ